MIINESYCSQHLVKQLLLNGFDYFNLDATLDHYTDVNGNTIDCKYQTCTHQKVLKWLRDELNVVIAIILCNSENKAITYKYIIDNSHYKCVSSEINDDYESVTEEAIIRVLQHCNNFECK